MLRVGKKNNLLLGNKGRVVNVVIYGIDPTCRLEVRNSLVKMHLPNMRSFM